MNKKVKPEDLGKEIASILDDFKNVTEEAAEAGVMDTAQKAVADLRAAHPSGSGQWGSWDKYNAGWTIRKETNKRRKGILAIVYNKAKPQLTHLLEKGHAKTNGGRTRAYPHIAPVEEKAEDELVLNILKRV